jgi:CubicO group peptidase (beta-lactamase class C family)
MRPARGTLFLVFAIVACSAWLVVYAAGTFDRAADRLMQREVERGHFSGTVLISRGTKVLFTKGYGLANADWYIPNSVDTKFEIGSITKTFSATLMLQLEQQKRLALTDSICRYIDSCPSSWAAVTLHHLLSHTSGIYNLRTSPRSMPPPRRALRSWQESLRIHWHSSRVPDSSTATPTTTCSRWSSKESRGRRLRPFLNHSRPGAISGKAL